MNLLSELLDDKPNGRINKEGFLSFYHEKLKNHL